MRINNVSELRGDNRMIRNSNIDIIKIISALGIVTFHFAIPSVSFLHDQTSINGYSWGHILVVFFFIASGFVLYCKYGKKEYSIMSFYKKRVISLFIPFWLVWFYEYYRYVCAYRELFYNGKPYYILLSLIGFDGYLYDYFPNNYYYTGEWFLGAIILCYILFPLLLYLYKISKRWIVLMIVILFYIQSRHNLLTKMDSFRNPICCILFFVIGFLIAEILKPEQKKKKHIIVLSLSLLFIMLLLSPISIPILSYLEKMLILSIAMFFVFYYAADLLPEKLKKWGGILGKYTYPFFLLQHIIVSRIINIYNPSKIIPTFIILSIIIVITFIFSWVVLLVSNAIIDRIKSKTIK